MRVLPCLYAGNHCPSRISLTVHGQLSGNGNSCPVSFHASSSASFQTVRSHSGSFRSGLRLGVRIRRLAMFSRWPMIVRRQLLPALGLILPFQQMRQQHGHAAFQFALFALAHVLDLPGEVFDVEFGVATAAQQLCLLAGPGQHILVVARRAHRLGPPAINGPDVRPAPRVPASGAGGGHHLRSGVPDFPPLSNPSPASGEGLKARSGSGGNHPVTASFFFTNSRFATSA